VLTSTEPSSGITLHTHQRAAIKATVKGLVDHDRGQLVMACGTGKTITAIKLAEALGVRRVLVLVPSLSLLAQIYRDWQEHSAAPFGSVAVCSDDSVTASDAAALACRPTGVGGTPTRRASAMSPPCPIEHYFSRFCRLDA
jgi:predicted helicase